MTDEQSDHGFINITIKADEYGYDTNLPPAAVEFWLDKLAFRAKLEALGIQLPE